MLKKAPISENYFPANISRENLTPIFCRSYLHEWKKNNTSYETHFQIGDKFKTFEEAYPKNS